MKQEKKYFYLTIFSLFLIIIFIVISPISLNKMASALTGNYSKSSGDNLDTADWNNLPSDFLDKSGDTMSGNLNMNSNSITDLADPTNPGDAVNLSTLTAATGPGGAANISDGTNNLFVYCGRTTPGATAWVAAGFGAYVDIDISGAGFTEGINPYIFTSMGGLNLHDRTRGATSIYSSNPGTQNNLDDMFRVVIVNDSGSTFNNSFVNEQWYINYCAYGY